VSYPTTLDRHRHCEKQSDEAILNFFPFWIASAIALRAMAETSLRSQ
jgi:hypothetical protein